MKPPICAICGRDSSGPDADLIAFTRTEADVEWTRMVGEDGFAGHPPWAEWFCRTHLPRAILLAREGLTLAQAIERMKKPAWIELLKALLGRSSDRSSPQPRGRAARPPTPRRPAHADARRPDVPGDPGKRSPPSGPDQ